MTAPSVPGPARAVRVVLVALFVIGLVLLGAAAWVESRSTSYGWFAYAPLSETTYVPAGAYSLGTAALLAGAGHFSSAVRSASSSDGAAGLPGTRPPATNLRLPRERAVGPLRLSGSQP